MYAKFFKFLLLLLVGSHLLLNAYYVSVVRASHMLFYLNVILFLLVTTWDEYLYTHGIGKETKAL